MADTIRSRAALLALFADNAAGDISAQDVRDFTVSAYEPQMIIPGGRLTLTTGVPVTTTDVTGATNIYYTPYLHNGIGLYDGTSWTLFAFSEITFALGTLTSGLNYDLFLYDNSGTLTLEATAWTNDTTRATALTLQDGVYVKSGATTRRYLGTFRTTSTTTTEDSATKRFLWNAYNRACRMLYKVGPGTNWTYNSSTIRSVNADTALRFELMVGLAGDKAVMRAGTRYTSNSANDHGFGFGYDSTTTRSNSFAGGNAGVANNYGLDASFYTHYPAVGYHYYQWTEQCFSSGGAITLAGGATTGGTPGMEGEWPC